MDSPNRTVIRVLFIASEAEPFIKVGGLGDVAGSLPLALKALARSASAEAEIDIRLCIPFYKVIQKTKFQFKSIGKFQLSVLKGTIPGEIFLTDLEGLPVYLIKSPVISNDPMIYNLDTRKDGEKFVFFSLAALELPRIIDWRPDIVHANDWHTALTVYKHNILREKDPIYKHTHSVITLHNLPFMGGGTEKAMHKFKIPTICTSDLPDWACYQPLPMGLYSADAIIPVSPHYAQELLTEEYGYELSTFFRKVKSKMIGILNGLDYYLWDPETDPLIPNRFSSKTLSDRLKNKTALQQELGLPVDSRIPLVIMVSRMDQQKGIDLALDALRKITSPKFQVVILGSGDPQLEQTAYLLQTKYPRRIRVILRYDAALAHRMYAAGDILLMPSRYEPCGLSQMIAMRYGCIPVARATGGLMDTIQNTTSKRIGTGFLFKKKTSQDLAECLLLAIQTYKNPVLWLQVQKKAMHRDFSWKKSAMDYYQQYCHLLEMKP